MLLPSNTWESGAFKRKEKTKMHTFSLVACRLARRAAACRYSAASFAPGHFCVQLFRLRHRPPISCQSLHSHSSSRVSLMTQLCLLTTHPCTCATEPHLRCFGRIPVNKTAVKEAQGSPKGSHSVARALRQLPGEIYIHP